MSCFYLYCVLFIALFFFFFTDPAPTEIYTLSLHDALPIWKGTAGGGGRARKTWPSRLRRRRSAPARRSARPRLRRPAFASDRKSTRLNSSHTVISYAVFCLKKKKKTKITTPIDSSEASHQP